MPLKNVCKLIVISKIANSRFIKQHFFLYFNILFVKTRRRDVACHVSTPTISSFIFKKFILRPFCRIIGDVVLNGFK